MTFCTLAGNYLPGAGSLYVRQSLNFLRPVYAGDTITATYWITEVNEARRKTTGQCVMTNQRGETVLTCLHYMKVIDPVEEGKGP